MKTKFTPSVNILRDAQRDLEYIVTPNAQQIANLVYSDYQKGIHSFTLIGSYGTGKSSFLMAFDTALRGDGELKIEGIGKAKTIQSFRIVGQFQSLIAYFEEHFDISSNYEGSQKIFDHLFQMSEASDLLVIYLDEFGKFLEYAAKFNPEKELYFLQQLAEFVNDHSRNIVLISTLHQNFEAYASNDLSSAQKREWKKVRGRFKELTFNEPVEQLLYLASEKLKSNGKKGKDFLDLAIAKNLLPFSSSSLDALRTSLAPLDIISAAVLTKALQQYGQNERSLFTFLESDIQSEAWADVAVVYDYLLNSFYSNLNSSYNSHYRHWQAMQAGVERAEFGGTADDHLCVVLVKTVGLLQVFASKAAQVDEDFLRSYFREMYSAEALNTALASLKKKSVLSYSKFNNSFKVIEGTDVDFDQALLRAEKNLPKSFDVISALKEHFEFPVLQAKKVSYEKGTPRLFGFEITDKLESVLTPSGAMDGYVKLIFNEQLDVDEVQASSKLHDEAIFYGWFTNSDSIQNRLLEILKTKIALRDNRDDFVAKKEFEVILSSNEKLLSHDVVDSLYTNKVRWFFKGTEVKGIIDQKALNHQLSLICDEVYRLSPKFDNELLNKHKISTSIHTARKNYFNQLVEHWSEPGLGFSDEKFPPEKTIYQSLLRENKMHKLHGKSWELGEPSGQNGFSEVWKASMEFLSSSREEKQSISRLWELLSKRPFKLKLGLIDFWVPTFLFINRGDFALYEEGRFIPYINDAVLYMMTRQPDKFEVKSFEITGVRLSVFNKYREFLEQSEQPKLNQESFIESVRPFLIFYKELNDYSKNTQRLSLEALELRKAIVDAQDPEKTFFEAIPKALSFSLSEIEQSEGSLAEFGAKLNDAVSEIKKVYSELLNRIEAFISHELTGKVMSFEDYKAHLQKRYKDLKEHRLLPKQKVFLQRVNSPLNDRNSWIASVGQSILGKTLDRIHDEEEEIFMDRFQFNIQELDNLLNLHKVKTEKGEQLFKIDVTGLDGMKTSNVRLSEKQVEEMQPALLEVKKLLGKNKKTRLAILTELIKNELKS